ncbi:MAG: monovalent cation/H(+) antiporter subunit G [Proteobacteria bacterium]|nr:monovalent cation/H(+) antiporter subunit G [Pseudomonadota bacterium]MBU1639642.1 monovalent cation/H(+) antiporter subunit G [Pseudomonadota bacterium]
MIDIVGTFFVILGIPFFLSGTIGLLRLPDIYTRLHALTKADNVGLGFIILGLAIQATSWFEVAKLFLIWFLVLLASATSCHLVADAALRHNIKPWTKERA